MEDSAKLEELAERRKEREKSKMELRAKILQAVQAVRETREITDRFINLLSQPEETSNGRQQQPQKETDSQRPQERSQQTTGTQRPQQRPQQNTGIHWSWSQHLPQQTPDTQRSQHGPQQTTGTQRSQHRPTLSTTPSIPPSPAKSLTGKFLAKVKKVKKTISNRLRDRLSSDEEEWDPHCKLSPISSSSSQRQQTSRPATPHHQQQQTPRTQFCGLYSGPFKAFCKTLGIDDSLVSFHKYQEWERAQLPRDQLQEWYANQFPEEQHEDEEGMETESNARHSTFGYGQQMAEQQWNEEQQQPSSSRGFYDYASASIGHDEEEMPNPYADWRRYDRLDEERELQKRAEEKRAREEKLKRQEVEYVRQLERRFAEQQREPASFRHSPMPDRTRASRPPVSPFRFNSPQGENFIFNNNIVRFTAAPRGRLFNRGRGSQTPSQQRSNRAQPSPPGQMENNEQEEFTFYEYWREQANPSSGRRQNPGWKKC